MFNQHPPDQGQRSFLIEAPETDDRTLTFSFSSEYPAMRMWGKEILSHVPGAMNFERAKSLNFLWNHNQDVVLGKVEDVWLENRRGRCRVKWSNSEKAQQFRQEVNDGILDNVSFYYTIDEVKEIPDGSIVVTRWTPLEISLVSVPVDPTVGVGRSLSLVAESILGESRVKTQEFKVNTMTVEEKPVDVEQLRSEAVTTERERIAAITALGRTHNMQDLAGTAITEGRSLDDFKGKVLEAIAKGSNQNPVAAAQPVNPLGLSHKEQKNYSILRGINACLERDWSKAGFEKECHDEIAKRSGTSPKGLLVPVRDLKVGLTEQRAPYVVGAPPFGGNLVQTDLLAQNFIDILRNRACVTKLGATMLSGLQGNVAIPRQNGATSTYWIAENGTITQSEATFDQITLTPKTIAARSQFSRLMLLQSSIDIEQFVRMDFAKTIALGIDDAALNGSGTGGVPLGIRNTPGIGSVALGANGGVPTWAAITQLETEVAQDNADVGEMAYLTNPKARGKLKNTLKSASAVSEFIWQDTQILDGMGMMNGYKAMSSNQAPSNLVKGTGTALSAIFFGCWSQLLIGEWGLLEIMPNSLGAGYNSGAVDIRVMQTLDIKTRYAEAFALVSDAQTV